MEKVSFVLGALLKHENEQKKKISHACKEKDLSLSKYSCKKTIKKDTFDVCNEMEDQITMVSKVAFTKKTLLTIDFTAT